MIRSFCIVLSFVGLHGCASIQPDPQRCADCVAIYEMDANLQQPVRGSEPPSAFVFCGEPTAWQDVRVIEIGDGQALEASVQDELGMPAQYVDRWYAVELEPKYIERARQTVARGGCNLLILGGSHSSRAILSSDPMGFLGRSEYRLVRWGVH